MTFLENNSTISFVLPAFNEGEYIEESLKRLDSNCKKTKTRHHEILVVNDGSKDDTQQKANKYAKKNKHVKIISYKRNEGKGFAVKAGALKATGETIVLLDSDLDIDIKQVNKYIKALQQGDIVIGSKYHPQSKVKTTITRKILSRGFNKLTRLLTGVKINDTQVGIKAIRRNNFFQIFNRLSVKRYAFDVELMVLANIYNLKIIELPVKLKVQNKLNIKEIGNMFLDLLGIAYRLRIKQYYKRS